MIQSDYNSTNYCLKISMIGESRTVNTMTRNLSDRYLTADMFHKKVKISGVSFEDEKAQWRDMVPGEYDYLKSTYLPTIKIH